MTAEIYQFIPRSNRSNHNADRAFWIGPGEAQATYDRTALGIVSIAIMGDDTAPSELDTTKDRE